MTRKAREIETLLLTMFAAVPLYLTYAVSRMPLIAFHVVMAAIVARVAMGKGPEIIPARYMRWLALAYIPFYFVDWRFLAGTAIAASTHLVLFIAVYQPIESMQRNNQAQRMLTTSLIFVASLATSTHVTVSIFVVLFALLMFRQLMYVSHLETVRSIDHRYNESPSGRAALFYLAGSILIGALLFPLLPRVRNPFVQAGLGSLPGGASALTETIDFSSPRIGSANDATIVARVWMNQESRPFFAPIRLRGMIYDRFMDGEWRQTARGLREVPSRGGSFNLLRASGVEREAIVQQRPQRGKLFLPVGTYAMSGLPSRLYEGPARDTYYTYHDGMVNLSVRMATQAEPLRLTRVAAMRYPVTPEVAALARRIVGNETNVRRQAAAIENYLSRNYRYIPNPADLGRAMSVEDFLLRTRVGHCEYFAAGMAVLMTSLDAPARIAGGYYGGRLNPLTGYFVVRRSDAHAWTEVWDGAQWRTFDSTPPDLRPGSTGVNAVREYLSALGDSMNFIWDRYVLTFGLGDQVSLAEEAMVWMREKWAAAKVSLQSDVDQVLSPPFALTIALLLALGAVAAYVTRGRGPLFDVLRKHLAARGIEVGPAMTMEEALRQLRAEQPEAAKQLEPLIALYEEERFSARPDRKRAATVRRKLAELT